LQRRRQRETQDGKKRDRGEDTEKRGRLENKVKETLGIDRGGEKSRRK
jgi:hypothetical protein